MKSIHIHQRLLQELIEVGIPAGTTQLVNLALLCQSLAFSSDCHLANLALNLPIDAQRENLIQRLRRALEDQTWASDTLYRPIRQQLFAHWNLREVCLVMDRTDIENRWSLLLLGASYKKRVLPLSWKVLPYGSSSAVEQMELLWKVEKDLPPRYWALDLAADLQAWRRGRKRYYIEPTFRDWKSYGFDLEGTKIEDPDRLEVLLLGMAMTTVWMIAVGDWLEGNGAKRIMAPAKKDDYSIFRLGRDYVRRCQVMSWRVPIRFEVGRRAEEVEFPSGIKTDQEAILSAAA